MSPRIIGPAQEEELVPLPWGINGRLALVALTTAVRTSDYPDARVTIARHINPLLTKLGRPRSGGARSSRRLIEKQVRSWLLTIVTLSWSKQESIQTPAVEYVVADKILTGELVLNPVYLHQARRHSVPLDLRAIRSFGKDILAFDLYAYLVHLSSRLEPHQSKQIPYDWLIQQGGNSRRNNPRYRAKVRERLEHIGPTIPSLEITAQPYQDSFTVAAKTA